VTPSSNEVSSFVYILPFIHISVLHIANSIILRNYIMVGIYFSG
jgi:hypothetical protein